MKIRVMVLSCLIGATVLFAGYEYSWAKSKAKDKTIVSGLKIGVLSVEKILQDCKKTAKYREEILAEQGKMVAIWEKLSKEIEAEKAGLKTLKEGSSDYLAAVKEILEKQAMLQAEREFDKQRLALKDHKMIEQLYQGILLKTAEVAEQKGLDMVFEKSEPKLPMANANELSQTISTHKLLYSAGCLDITDEVMARLDAEN